MEYNLPRQEIAEDLVHFAIKMIKLDRIYIPKATNDNLKDIAAISKQIQENGLPKHLVIKKLKGKLGYGVFLHPEAKPIQKGEAIGPYSGEVYLAPLNHGDSSDYAFSLISDLKLTKAEQLQLDPKTKYHPRRLYSLDLDADKKGNFTRFINHSDKPNVEANLMKIPQNRKGLKPSPCEIIYFAKKKILPGEQLLTCYDDKEKCYWGVQKIKPFPMTPQTFKLDSKLNLVTCTQV